MVGKRATGAASKHTPEDQHARFLETARQLGCDEDKERFEAKLGKIAKQKRPREEAKPPSGKDKG